MLAATRRNACGFVSAALAAVTMFGCEPRDTSTPGAGGAAPVTLEVKSQPAGKKAIKPEDVANEVESVGGKEWIKKMGKPDYRLVESEHLRIGWKGFTTDANGKPHHLTVFTFDTNYKLVPHDGKPAVQVVSEPTPFPADGVMSRDAIREAVAGMPPDEVKRIMGVPADTAVIGDSSIWSYHKRSQDDVTGKVDDQVAVFFSEGYAYKIGTY